MGVLISFFRSLVLWFFVRFFHFPFPLYDKTVGFSHFGIGCQVRLFLVRTLKRYPKLRFFSFRVSKMKWLKWYVSVLMVKKKISKINVSLISSACNLVMDRSVLAVFGHVGWVTYRGIKRNKNGQKTNKKANELEIICHCDLRNNKLLSWKMSLWVWLNSQSCWDLGFMRVLIRWYLVAIVEIILLAGKLQYCIMQNRVL